MDFSLRSECFHERVRNARGSSKKCSVPTSPAVSPKVGVSSAIKPVPNIPTRILAKCPRAQRLRRPQQRGDACASAAFVHRSSRSGGSYFIVQAVFRLLAVLAYFGAGSAKAADSGEIRSSCWASGTLSEDVVTIARKTERWSCNDRTFSILRNGRIRTHGCNGARLGGHDA